MSVALKNTVRVTMLTLLVAGLSGCGTENPMGPAALAVSPPLETSVAVMPIEELPAPDDGVLPPTLISNPGGSTAIGSKSLWSERPGRRVGRGRDK